MNLTARSAIFASASIALGAWTFKKVNEISGPAFEPILAACTDSSIAIEDFAEKTGYHTYEPKVGLGVFNFLVCLITQFLLELRTTYPDGLLVWGGVIVSSLPYSVMCTIESGRQDARGPIRYPMIIGLLCQLLGISVIVPLVWVPSYIFGHGYGPVSPWRAYLSVPLALPGVILTTIIFTADTNGDLWTVCAGILGGPLLVLAGALFWPDDPPSTTRYSIQSLDRSSIASRRAYLAATLVAFVGWIFLLYVAFSTYGTNVRALWDALWTNAGPSVAFMTVDSIVLYIATVVFVAYRSSSAAIKAILLTPLLGPGAVSLVLAELEPSSANREEIMTNSLVKKTQ